MNYNKSNRTSHSLDEGFVPPPSIQSDLFNYLKPAQQEFIRPILRVMKKPAQEELCCMLLDYMESGEVIMTNDVVVGGMFNYLTRYRMPDDNDPADKRIIRPLCTKGFKGSKFQSSKFAPMPIGEIIDRFFPNLKNKSLTSNLSPSLLAWSGAEQPLTRI